MSGPSRPCERRLRVDAQADMSCFSGGQGHTGLECSVELLDNTTYKIKLKVQYYYVLQSMYYRVCTTECLYTAAHLRAWCTDMLRKCKCTKYNYILKLQ